MFVSCEMDPSKVIVCRCEEVTLKEVRDLIAQGYKTIDEIKRISRCGMGPCQGRTCRSIIAAEIARARGIPVAGVEMPTARPPVKPITLGAVVRGSEHE